MTLADRSPTSATTPAFDFEQESHESLRECDSIARAALEHVGKRYRITRELEPGVIDCSTIVSQSHWVGAAVQMPFVAETQRLASNGFDLAGLDQLLPGDLLFAYPSRAASPGGRHNHVALYMGSDIAGDRWAIESRDPVGVRFSRLDTFTSAGGVRRYAPNPNRTFAPGPWLELVRRVPKLGRLGARLTARYTVAERHSGVDVYLDPGTPLLSPVAGTVAAVTPLGQDACVLVVQGIDDVILTVLAPLVRDRELRVGDAIHNGEPVGTLSGTRVPMLCNSVPSRARAATGRLHWEVWTSNVTTSPARELRPSLFPSFVAAEQLRAQNPLYLVKAGDVGSPALVPARAPQRGEGATANLASGPDGAGSPEPGSTASVL